MQMQDEITLAPYGYDKDGNANGPNPTQQRILEWVDSVRNGGARETIPVLYLQGGVGSGKTRGVSAPVQEMLCEIEGIEILWARLDYKDLKMSAERLFLETFPQALVNRKSEQYHWYEINVVKEEGEKKKCSRLSFAGIKDISGLGSQEFAVIVLTEAHETTEYQYRALKRRCRQANKPVMILLESEAPTDAHWLTILTDPSNENYDPDIEKWELSTYENWDNLTQAYRGSLETMPASWRRKYLSGKTGFIPDGKPFYENFNERFHVDNLHANPLKEITMSWDFGFHSPAVSFHQFDELHWNVLKEIMGTDCTLDAFIRNGVKPFINEHFPGAALRHFGDPACMQHNDKSETTSFKICQDHGFNLKVRQSTYRDRKEIIERQMSTLYNGKPVLRVDRSCKIIIDGFLGGYHYPERKQGSPALDKYSQPFKDGWYEHLMNTVEYVAVNVFKPTNYVAGDNPKREAVKEQRHVSRFISKQNDKRNKSNAGFGY